MILSHYSSPGTVPRPLPGPDQRPGKGHASLRVLERGASKTARVARDIQTRTSSDVLGRSAGVVARMGDRVVTRVSAHDHARVAAQAERVRGVAGRVAGGASGVEVVAAFTSAVAPPAAIVAGPVATTAAVVKGSAGAVRDVAGVVVRRETDLDRLQVIAQESQRCYELLQATAKLAEEHAVQIPTLDTHHLSAEQEKDTATRQRMVRVERGRKVAHGTTIVAGAVGVGTAIASAAGVTAPVTGSIAVTSAVVATVSAVTEYFLKKYHEDLRNGVFGATRHEAEQYIYQQVCLSFTETMLREIECQCLASDGHVSPEQLARRIVGEEGGEKSHRSYLDRLVHDVRKKLSPRTVVQGAVFGVGAGLAIASGIPPIGDQQIAAGVIDGVGGLGDLVGEAAESTASKEIRRGDLELLQAQAVQARVRGHFERVRDRLDEW